MPEEPRLRYSIYKIGDVELCRAILESKNFRRIPLDLNHPDWELYIPPPRRNAPKWTSALARIVRDPASLASVVDTTNSFVLLIPSSGSFFGVCGGLGSFALQKCIVEDFGLDIVCRVVESDRIKYKRSKNLSGKTAQEESLYKEYYNYEFDTSNWAKLTKEILGEIKQADLTDFFGLTSESRHKIRLDGKNSLAVNRSIPLGDLKTLIDSLADIEGRDPKFRIFKGFQEVTDRAVTRELMQALSEILVREFQSYLENEDAFQETKIGISFADMKEFLLCDTFELTLGRHGKVLEDGMDLATIFQFLRESNKTEFHASYLNGISIIGKDADGLPKVDAALKSFLYAELERAERKHFFIDGRWFLISSDFQTEVDRRLSEIVAGSTQALGGGYRLPPWRIAAGRLETEDDYIENVCTQTHFHQLHRDHVIIHGVDKCEVCDILDLRGGNNAFVYVKRGLGSALRELLAQTRSSAELYARSRQFKVDSVAKIEAKIGGAFPDHDSRRILWVLAFTDHSLHRDGRALSERLTTVVKTDIVHTFDFLRELELSRSGLYEIAHA